MPITTEPVLPIESEFTRALEVGEFNKATDFLLKKHADWINKDRNDYKLNYHLQYFKHMNKEVVRSYLELATELTKATAGLEKYKTLNCAQAVMNDQKLDQNVKDNVAQAINQFKSSNATISDISTLRTKLAEHNIKNDKLLSELVGLECFNKTILKLSTQLKDQKKNPIIQEYIQLEHALKSLHKIDGLARGKKSENIAQINIQMKYDGDPSIVILTGLTIGKSNKCRAPSGIKQEFDVIAVKLDSSNPKKITEIIEIGEVKSSVRAVTNDFPKLQRARDHLNTIIKNDAPLKLIAKATKESYEVADTAFTNPQICYYVPSNGLVQFHLFSSISLEQILSIKNVMEIMDSAQKLDKQIIMQRLAAVKVYPKMIPLFEICKQTVQTNRELVSYIHVIRSPIPERRQNKAAKAPQGEHSFFAKKALQLSAAPIRMPCRSSR